MYIDSFTIAGIVAGIGVLGLLYWVCKQSKRRRCLGGQSPCG